ncbi:aminoglycoside phosphotransferase family protein [Nocardia farcinica]|uniref:aminoglycoside phosphotransferase family protein n=1 Tax=Nocardia farcinica TaxID=37329 RepID=UPI002455CCA3|nr:aminoglycoside phosphotransferase family protein [Nocardia farcinica]
MEHPTRAILEQACTAVGLSSAEAEVISLGENAIYRLRPAIVARISRPGQLEVARREITVSRWLESTGTPAVRVFGDVDDQPVRVGDRAVTFWHELPPHVNSSPATVARVLRTLHSLAPPRTGIPALDPFARLDRRIDAAASLTGDDRDWMRARLGTLRHRWSDTHISRTLCAIHGDAHDGNIVTAADGEPIIIDLERFSIGPPEWDLTQTAVDFKTCGWISRQRYAEFVDTYGYDVTQATDFELFRDIREFRMTAWLAQQAAEKPQLREQARHRVECLRGLHGSRPWTGWKAQY